MLKSFSISARHVDNNKYYQPGSSLEGIQISEDEIASDPERHRSLRKHRRGTSITCILSRMRGESPFCNSSIPIVSIFSRAGNAVMI